MLANLDHPYNITKCAGDLLAQCYSRLYSLPTVILRLGTLYGPKMRDAAVIPKLIKLASQGKTITIHGSGAQYWQFVHVRDAAKAFVLALERGADEGIYNIVSNERITVRQIAEMTGGKIEYTSARPGDVQPLHVDNTLAREWLGWSPTIPFEVGFREMCEALGHVPAAIAPSFAVAGSGAQPRQTPGAA